MAPPDGGVPRRRVDAGGAAARAAGITVVLGTERIVNGRHRISTLVVNADGSIAGFHDKVQLDPSEEATWAAGGERHVYTAGPLTFGAGHLPRGVALSGDGALGGAARRAGGVRARTSTKPSPAATGR